MVAIGYRFPMGAFIFGRNPRAAGGGRAGRRSSISSGTSILRGSFEVMHGLSEAFRPVWHLYARTMQKAVAAARLSDYIGALGQRCSLRLAV